MALIFTEGFDAYTSDADAEQRGWHIESGIGVAISSDYRRGDSGYGVGMNSSYAFYRYLPTTYTTVYVGFAQLKRQNGTPSPDMSNAWFYVGDESGAHQVQLHINADHSISAWLGDHSTLLGSTAAGVYPTSTSQWNYWEVKVTIDNSAGEVVLRKNEEVVLNLTSQDTKYGSDYIGRLYWRPVYNNIGISLDDIYVDSSQFHGNCVVKTFMPDSDSATHTDFERSGGSFDYECVDEIPPNDDTDYIKSSTVGHISTFGITTGSLNTVKGINVKNFARLVGGGTRSIKPIVRSNGADYQGTEVEVTTGPTYICEPTAGIWETDPDDSNAWTQTKLEAAEFGLEITA